MSDRAEKPDTTGATSPALTRREALKLGGLSINRSHNMGCVQTSSVRLTRNRDNLFRINNF